MVQMAFDHGLIIYLGIKRIACKTEAVLVVKMRTGTYRRLKLAIKQTGTKVHVSSTDSQNAARVKATRFIMKWLENE